MTSIPASRRARAMIFAPRSCPSRPGLATTTRIFFFVAVDMAGAPPQARQRAREIIRSNLRAAPGAVMALGATRECAHLAGRGDVLREEDHAAQPLRSSGP